MGDEPNQDNAMDHPNRVSVETIDSLYPEHCLVLLYLLVYDGVTDHPDGAWSKQTSCLSSGVKHKKPYMMCPDNFNKNVISANKITVRVNHMNKNKVLECWGFFYSPELFVKQTYLRVLERLKPLWLLCINQPLMNGRLAGDFLLGQLISQNCFFFLQNRCQCSMSNIEYQKRRTTSVSFVHTFLCLCCIRQIWFIETYAHTHKY